VDGQCDKLVTVVGHQFITLTVNMCTLQHGGGGREAPHRVGLTAAAETYLNYFHLIVKLLKVNYFCLMSKRANN